MMMRQRPHVSNNLKQKKTGTHLLSFHSTSADAYANRLGVSCSFKFAEFLLYSPHMSSSNVKAVPYTGSWLAIPMQEPRVIRHLHMTEQAMLSPERDEDPAFWEEKHRKATAPGFLNYCTSLPF